MNEKKKLAFVIVAAIAVIALLAVLLLFLTANKTVTFVVGEDVFVVDMRGGASVPQPPEINGYVFIGWYLGDKEFNGSVEDGEIYYAKYQPKEYSVVFKNYDGTVLYETKQSFGKRIASPEIIPTKPSSESFDYVFKGFNGYSDYLTVNGDMEFVAEYVEVIRVYTVRFLINGELYFTAEVPYGSEIKVDFPNLVGYEFSGWSCGSCFTVTRNEIFEAELLNIEEELRKQAQELDSFVEGLIIGFYSDEALEEIRTIADSYKRLIIGKQAISDGRALLEEAYSSINAVESYPSLIDDYVEGLGRDNYFDEQLKEIDEIVSYAVFRLKSYKSGVPTRETIFKECCEQLDKVLTKDEDIELAEWMKEKKILLLKSYVEDYSDTEAYAELLNKFALAQEEIRDAVGSYRVNEAYLKWLSIIKVYVGDEK